jgi:hypothetical protein
MKKVLIGLAVCCLLMSAVPVVSGEAPEGTAELTAEGAPEGAAELPAERAPDASDGQMRLFPVTAQQWIRGFYAAAGEQEPAWDCFFTYDPGLITGQHVYSLTLLQTDACLIGLSVFSEDGVAVSSCALRMVSGMLRSDELVRVNALLGQAARAMVAASEPEAGFDDIDELLYALCPDLPAALLREAPVECIHWLGKISCSLWAGVLEDAFFGSHSQPIRGYIADYVIRADAPDEPG